MIASYKCKETLKLKVEGASRKFKAIERIALRKLDMLEAVVDLETLRTALDIFDRGRTLLEQDPVRLERWNIAGLGLDRAILTRQIHLTQAHRRAGGKAGSIPFDFRNILQRARRVHQDYIDKYIVRQAHSLHYAKNAAKTVNQIGKYYERLEKDLNDLEKFCKTQ